MAYPYTKYILHDQKSIDYMFNFVETHLTNHISEINSKEMPLYVKKIIIQIQYLDPLLSHFRNKDVTH